MRLTWAYRSVWTLGAAIAIVIASAMPGLAQDEATPSTDSAEESCFDGRLRIRDLETADRTLAEGLTAVQEEATAWEADARLNTLRLGCPLLETGYQWEGTFFSEAAQAFYSTDTGVVDAANDDPSTIPTLVATNLQMVVVYISILRAGFDRDSVLGGTSVVTVKRSTDDQPFGPPSAPRGQDYAHVAIVQRGEVIDLWIAMSDGKIFRYE